jgi:hypothetical protein
MKMKIFLITLMLWTINTSSISPENVVVAINCGGEDFKDSNGIHYEKVKIL